MSQEWQRGREGERLRETDGESGVGDLQRRAEEEGSVTTHGRDGKRKRAKFSTSFKVDNHFYN